MIKSEWMNPNRTLKEKYTDFFQSMETNPSGYVKMPDERKFDNCDRGWHITPIWFLATIVAGFFLVCHIFLPANYKDESTVFYHTFYISFVIIELLTSAMMTKYVSSMYEPTPDLIRNLGKQAEYSLTYNAPENQCVANGETSILISDSEQGNDGKMVCKERNAWTPILVQVASPEEVANGVNKRENFPYWSWKPCSICKHQRPPRSHHCPLCGKCVLKRDHHCYFTNSCIGVKNQRYFAVLIFWSFQATSYALFQAIFYVPTLMVDDAKYVDLFPPIGILRWLLGYLEGSKLLLFISLFSIAWVLIQCIALATGQILMILRGRTLFEEQQRFKIINTNNRMENIRAVFGDYPLLSFFFPIHGILPSKDNGLTWPNIKT